MTTEDDIPPQSLERTGRAAEATARDPQTLVRQAVEIASRPAIEEIVRRRSETWIADLLTWAASQPRRKHSVDDCRESIYGDER
jgi:hypothetical protein